MFDVLLREMATRFGLGEKARDVLAALLALMFDPQSGGFDGFVRRLRAGGLGKQVDSWLGRGENQPVNSTALEHALGAPLIAALAVPAGLTQARMASTLTALLPSVLDKLSPDGVRPAEGAIPGAVAPLIAGQSSFVAGARALWPVFEGQHVVAEVSKPVVAATSSASHHPHASVATERADTHGHDDHGPSRDGGMGGRWIVWLTLAGILAAGGWWFASMRATPALPQTLTQLPATRSPIELPAVQAQPTLQITVQADAVRITGQVDGSTTIQTIEGAARAQFGERLQIALQADAKLGPAPWLQVLLGAMPALDRPGLMLELSGLNADLQAVPEGQDEATALAELSPLFAKLRRGGLFDPAIRAFGRLPEQGLDGVQLVAALNLMRVHFESGSRTLRDDSRRVLKHAASVLARAPEQSLFEIGGHTDSRGDAQSNRDLSEQRAFAVQEALVGDGVHPSRLTARGYGSSVPLAENSTREGRAQNRRIEFTLLR